MKPVDDPHQLAIMERVLAQECAARRHVVVHLSGAHAYGFPSPDSDLDLKAIHVEPTARLLGLDEPSAAHNRLEIIEGVEIDYTSNELRVALRGLLRGDGNMLERVCSEAPVVGSDWLAPLRELALRSLSRRYHHHYRGFASAQRKAADAMPAPAAKKVLYVLRTALTGVHLLRARQCEPDLTVLAVEYGFDLVPELVAIKQQAEKQTLAPALAQAVGPAMDRAFTLLAEARDTSPLPEDPPHAAELEAWLVQVRRADLAATA